jgi:hypothetical protein
MHKAPGPQFLLRLSTKFQKEVLTFLRQIVQPSGPPSATQLAIMFEAGIQPNSGFRSEQSIGSFFKKERLAYFYSL